VTNTPILYLIVLINNNRVINKNINNMRKKKKKKKVAETKNMRLDSLHQAQQQQKIVNDI